MKLTLHYGLLDLIIPSPTAVLEIDYKEQMILSKIMKLIRMFSQF